MSLSLKYVVELYHSAIRRKLHALWTTAPGGRIFSGVGLDMTIFTFIIL